MGPDLVTFVRRVESEATDGSPLGWLHEAVGLGRALGETADALVDHFVQHARAAGHSWSEIGGVLGVTKQAAQQRFVAGVRGVPRFTRFTHRARRMLEHAEEEARALAHNYVGTEHLLLGLLASEDSIAHKALTAEGIRLEEVREGVITRIGRGRTPPGPGSIPLTPRAHGALKRAIREARRMGHNYVGTEHVLLAVSGDEAGVAAQILGEMGTGPDALRPIVVALLARLEPPAQPR